MQGGLIPQHCSILFGTETSIFLEVKFFKDIHFLGFNSYLSNEGFSINGSLSIDWFIFNNTSLLEYDRKELEKMNINSAKNVNLTKFILTLLKEIDLLIVKIIRKIEQCTNHG